MQYQATFSLQLCASQWLVTYARAQLLTQKVSATALFVPKVPTQYIYLVMATRLVCARTGRRPCSSVVEQQLRKLKVRGSIPRWGSVLCLLLVLACFVNHFTQLEC